MVGWLVLNVIASKTVLNWNGKVLTATLNVYKLFSS
jgi:hypothetical protein